MSEAKQIKSINEKIRGFEGTSCKAFKYLIFVKKRGLVYSMSESK